ncbi:probable beta-1,3-galactosyltransferase 14 [Malania oleifera]|uniref:probable beta-1,3-galactosyltransferase 14 n=1 Tax=Malania oleifera TaxID=397392 RepID=UPI0025AE7006|nr:probable beta-1,3-galactosyltransferase 14 [Malania oleifera]
MPSSPKFFHARPPSGPRSRQSTALFLCLVIGLAGFIFGLGSILSPVWGYRCRNSKPRSVSVVWERSGSVGNEDGVKIGDRKRHKVMGFVGIQTGFGSVGRRRSLRKTWMPSDRQGLQRLEEATGLAFRFVIGRTNNEWKMAQLRKEVEQYDDFMLLDIEEEYSKLPYKTLAFFKAAYELFDSEFYVKADDDIYLRPDRLSLLLAKERSNPQTYLGCMKKGPVFVDPKLKWYEPLSNLLGKEYFLHAYGPIYALSADVVASLVALRNNSFRMFSNEDVTIGAWMLAMNVNHENNHALCEHECTTSSVAVWDIPRCSGLCNPEKKLLELHQMKICSNSPTVESYDDD